MADFAQSIAEHKDLSIEEQKKAGQAIGGAMDAEHTNFVKTITDMINKKEIDTAVPETFLNKEIYDKLDEMQKAKVDISMLNIADMLRHIHEFYVSKKTPDASPQLMTMIEELWQMKSRVETQYGDVFKF